MSFLKLDGHVLTDDWQVLDCCDGALKFFGLEPGQHVDQEMTVKILTYNQIAIMEKLNEQEPC